MSDYKGVNMIAQIVEEYRNKKIEGKIIDLVPVSQDDAANIAELRNRARNRYFMNQTYELTAESQARWLEGYFNRNDDIYWCICDKQGDFIGTVRAYNISRDGKLCENGSFMIDEHYSEMAPFAVEAIVLSSDFSFDVLGVEKIVNTIRTDNKVMNNLARRIGHEFSKIIMINDVEYNHYELTREAYMNNREKFVSLIEYWATRGTMAF